MTTYLRIRVNISILTRWCQLFAIHGNLIMKRRRLSSRLEQHDIQRLLGQRHSNDLIRFASTPSADESILSDCHSSAIEPIYIRC